MLWKGSCVDALQSIMQEHPQRYGGGQKYQGGIQKLCGYISIWTSYQLYTRALFWITDGLVLPTKSRNPSVGLKLKIPKEPQLFYFGTENFEQFRFHSI